jgi:hypothetical protein
MFTHIEKSKYNWKFAFMFRLCKHFPSLDSCNCCKCNHLLLELNGTAFEAAKEKSVDIFSAACLTLPLILCYEQLECIHNGAVE